MNSDTRGILIGMVFGDAYLGVGLRKTGYMRSEMSVVHSIVQKDYCEHKAALIRKHLNLNVNITVRKNGPGGKYKASCFCITHPYFKQLKRWLYPGGVKTFTSKALNMITPEGIPGYIRVDSVHQCEFLLHEKPSSQYKCEEKGIKK